MTPAKAAGRKWVRQRSLEIAGMGAGLGQGCLAPSRTHTERGRRKCWVLGSSVTSRKGGKGGRSSDAKQGGDKNLV